MKQCRDRPTCVCLSACLPVGVGTMHLHETMQGWAYMCVSGGGGGGWDNASAWISAGIHVSVCEGIGYSTGKRNWDAQKH